MLSSIAFYAFATAFLLSFVLLPIIINILTKWQIMDIGGRRKIHRGFTPSMGGIAIFTGFLLAIIFWVPVSFWVVYKYLIFACCIVFFTGLRDDLVELSPRGKLALQILAALMIMWNGGNDAGSIRIASFYGFLGIHELPIWASYGVTLFVVVVITNAFNLIDGLNGLAGTLGLLAFSLLAMWFINVGNDNNQSLTLGIFAVAMIGATLAFLCFNWHPASIFMGDTGSLVLGFFLSVCVVKFFGINGNPTFVSEWKLGAPVSMAISVAIIPLLDTGRIFVLRLSKGRSPFSPDKLHIHHLLIRMGLNHAQATIIMGCLYLCFIGVMVVLSRFFTDNVLVPFIFIMGIGLHFALRYIVDTVFEKKQFRILQKIAQEN
jgi:UDP-N-acetylmuramyl pentapeptide phosphotransferase/UDP-N-acetylglucosamine-1-phosphate transferase